MSGMALIWAANVKGLKPAAKIVLIQLADFHNKETGQCNPSAQRLADECEMGRATLFRHMTTLEECRLVTRHARGDGDGGRGSNQYELHLDLTLGPSARPKNGGRGQNGVSSQNETGGKVSKKRGKRLKDETGVVSNRDRNLTIEPMKEPPSRRREAVEAERVLEAYPPDRIRCKSDCLAQIEEAMTKGIKREDLLQAVQAYATESARFTRSKVCFSDNWFRMRRWQVYVEKAVEDRKKAQALEADHHVRLMELGCAPHRRTEQLKEQQALFEAALRQLDIERIVGGYRPALSQEALNSVDWKSPWPTVELIEQERTRIAKYLEEHWRKAEFPESPTFLVRAGMEKVWRKPQGRIHQHFFGRLDLPLFFDRKRDPNGLILFEMTRHDTDHYGNEEWIGVNSRWIYGRNPPQLSDPLSKAAT